MEMDLESGVYGLSAGAIIVLMAYTLGYRLTFQQRMQRMGYWFIATFLFIVLQLGGAGAAFALLSGIALVLLLIYMAVRKLMVRQPR